MYSKETSVVFLFALYIVVPSNGVVMLFPTLVRFMSRCREVTTHVPDFNLTSFLGEWYLYEARDVRDNGYLSRRIEITNTTGNVRADIHYGCWWSQRCEYNDTTLVSPYSHNVTQVNVSRPEVLSFGDDEIVQILDTDYDSFAVAIFCKRYMMWYGTVYLRAYTWILTRSPNVAPSNMTDIRRDLNAQGAPAFGEVPWGECLPTAGIRSSENQILEGITITSQAPSSYYCHDEHTQSPEFDYDEYYDELYGEYDEY